MLLDHECAKIIHRVRDLIPGTFTHHRKVTNIYFLDLTGRLPEICQILWRLKLEGYLFHHLYKTKKNARIPRRVSKRDLMCTCHTMCDFGVCVFGYRRKILTLFIQLTFFANYLQF